MRKWLGYLAAIVAVTVAGVVVADNVSQWNISAASNTGSPPNGAPEGMAPSTVNDILREMMAATARWYQDTDGGLVTAGSGNAFTITTNSGHASLAAQSTIVFRADRANTGASTLNVDGLGAKSLRFDGSALAGAELVANKVYRVAYNSNDDAYDLQGFLPIVPITKGGTDAVTAAAARTNLGISATGADTTYAFRANNLSDLASASTARTNIGAAATSHTHANGDLTGYTAADVLSKTITVDGAGSGLDADLLDGNSSAAFFSSSNQNAGTLPDARFPSTLPALSGVNLTSLNASNLASGTVGDARIGSSSVTQHMDDGYGRNITGKAGVTKTISTSSPSGGSDGDIWYKY